MSESKKNMVRDMFNHIAPTYDRLNHLLSFGIDRLWRRRTVRRVAAARPQRILDLACDLETDVVTTHIGVVPADVSHPRYAVMQEACRKLFHLLNEEEVPQRTILPYRVVLEKSTGEGFPVT